MRYYYCEKYPIEFVLSENLDKCFSPHNHVGHYVISVVMQGTAEVYLESRKLACYEGGAFIIPPYMMHSVYLEKNVRLLSMCIGTSFVAETDFETAEGIVRELLEDAARQGIFGREQKETLFDSLQMVFHARNTAGNELGADIKLLADQITSHPEERLPIEALAAEIFVSKYYFIRKFKRSVGMTPHRFCIQNRIRKAQRLLDAEKAVGRVAVEMGFYDQSHFDKAFLEIVGISPSEYLASKNMIPQSL